MQQESRNTIIFFGLAVVLLIVYQFFVMEPQTRKRQAELKAKQAEAAQAAAPAKIPDLPTARAGALSRAAALAESPRVPIQTTGQDKGKTVPVLSGSVNLKGGRIDDLQLDQYGQTVAKDSPRVDLLRPEGTANAWFAQFGWVGQNVVGLPDENTLWTLKSGQTLTDKTPIVLSYDNGAGLVFNRRISVDQHFMFTVTDSVTNTTGQPVAIQPYAAVRRAGLPPEAGKGQNVHEGAVGWLDKELRKQKYKAWKKKGQFDWTSQGGWLGITDKYWLTAIVPAQNETFSARYVSVNQGGRDIYAVDATGAAHTVAPGATFSDTTRLFAGAKKVQQLQAYQKALNIPNLDQAVDWGTLFFLTRPFFMALEFFYGLVGNFGLAILAVTLCVRIILFPLANKSYESMSKMKKLTEPMNKIKEQYKDDPAKMQQETMALYAREKVNPLLGCLPLALQIPVFLAFYKVLSTTIEMRHAPFFGFVKDLSARDPTNIWNLFGLLPFDPASVPLAGPFMAGALGLGVCVLLYGFTMWLTTAMNPPAPDPMQQRIFQLMPLLFTFIMAPFAVGLIIYWTFSNVLSIIQQYIIMHRLKVDNPIDDFIGRFRSKAV
ncbi:MAG: membrane protein insertase YidC [Caulobacter sp.]|nr:membrane protein insertase YidC [Caulobacter sp.]